MGVIEIEMVPIYHTYEQRIHYVYFAIIAYYLNIFENMLRVIGSPILNVYAEFGIYLTNQLQIYHYCDTKLYLH